ncbi:YxeA family protein [Bacillus cereus]|uniref:YxeA family protein n=1 Tax=Bacillus cereus TaxID=1396 RepID=UPI000B4BF361|nr:YxeA family protein [Bacillus cereus]
MKRYIALFSILVVFATMLVGCDLNRMGKDKYYVQITVDGKVYTGKTDNGAPYTEYQYKLAGYDKDGNEKEMEFGHHKNLRKEAFLRVYHSDKKGVTAWEEVKKDELPAKVKEKLGVK